MGQFVSLRGRLWLVEEQPETPFDGHRLACVDDDASGEDAQVLWSAEVDARLRDEEAWASLASGGGDAETFSAYLRTVRWRTATAAERDLFQAPFRAGIRLDPYQLLPLRKALRLPRVNLLIADDVGLGKTVEAGLVLREMLLRRRVDYMVVVAPAAMTGQWRDELQTKFGLSFEIIDRQHLESLRQRRGYGANPWATGSRFILSHRLLGDEAYVAGLRDVLEEFRARSLLILDEAHHAAPAGGGRYAVESQFTRSLRDLSDRFEHRLFLSATPHNGHPNSFATLLELLDPQRFTRGVPVRPADLEPVMVRRLKSDLRALGEAFPERVVEPVVIDGLDRHAPELRLAAMLADYRALRERRIGTLGAAQGARARLAFVGLQQRLLSSVPAFARTLRVHLAGLERLIAGETAQPVVADEDPDAPERADEEDAAFERLDHAEAARTEAAAMAAGGAAAQLMAERDHAAAMLVVADAAKTAPDARVRWIIDWARANLLDAEGRWRDRRLILFTEYEDTRRWLQRQLSVLLDPADADEVARIDSFTGVTSTERREAIKRAFNDPASPLRILLCTDAAREGINLQAQCHDLIHVDLPWNPSRLEQRNGRIDRKLQPSDTVTCRYFVYAQRPEDVVLDALVRKTEAIRRQLGSAGEVLGDRIADRLGRGIDRAAARDLAERIRNKEADERVRAAVRDLDDGEEARRARLMREQADLAAMLDKARARVGVDPDELRSVVGLALARAGGGWGATGAVGDTPVFALDQAAPAFAGDPSWQPMLDELRARGPKPGERPGEWRASADAGVRRVSFAPAILPDGRDAGDVVQLHLEHRLVRRLLGRFLSAGFQQGLDRACVIETPATPAPRVVLIGRLALYGERAARLHEEVLSVAADWRDRERDEAGLRPLAEGRDAEARVLDELIAALAGARTAGAAVARRATAHALADVGDLRSVLEGRAAARGQRVAAELEKRAASEAAGLETLLGQRIARIRRERREDDRQFALLLDPAEARQRAADRRSWERAVTRLDDELVREPERLRAAARVRATRLEPIGLVYLWPAA
ncbi:ATP-dependent helicase [Sphingomonas carotinifaciens]|nr:DISARM system SNF2-like helicase DrmD [Sphingomonas carotinifaciens]MWC44763.1 ATP-dependent helicase [Sphingomonas carotinifaciens]